MIHYSDPDRDSNIQGYDFGTDWITVYFKDNSAYTYTRSSAGSNAVEDMIALARRGDGLNAYISRHHPNYQSKS